MDSGVILAVAFAVSTGLIVNEIFDLSAWLAIVVVQKSAKVKYRDPDKAELRREELAAHINERPGNLLKLFTALWFLIDASFHKVERAPNTVDDRHESPENLENSLFDRFRTLRYIPDVPSPITARYLYPTEKYRGEWRKHWIQPARRIILLALIALILTLRPSIPIPQVPTEYGHYVTAIADIWTDLTRNELVYLAAVWGMAAALSAFMVLSWYLERFFISNKRLMQVKGVLRRRTTSVPLSVAMEMQVRSSPIGITLNYGTFVFYRSSGWNPLRKVRCLPSPNELYLQICEEMYDPGAIDEWAAGTEEELFPSSYSPFSESHRNVGTSRPLKSPFEGDDDGRNDQNPNDDGGAPAPVPLR